MLLAVEPPCDISLCYMHPNNYTYLEDESEPSTQDVQSPLIWYNIQQRNTRRGHALTVPKETPHGILVAFSFVNILRLLHLPHYVAPIAVRHIEVKLLSSFHAHIKDIFQVTSNVSHDTNHPDSDYCKTH